jgi:hypothetical protein
MEDSAHRKFVASTSFFAAVARSTQRRNSSKWLNARACNFVHPDGEIDNSRTFDTLSIRVCMPR